VAPQARLTLAVRFTIEGNRVGGYELIGAADRLAALELSVLDEPTDRTV